MSTAPRHLILPDRLVITRSVMRSALRVALRVALRLVLRIGLILCLALTGGAAWAGAWPRTKGELFMAPSFRLTTSAARTTGDGGLYLDYGLTDRLSVGLDWTRSLNGAGKTIAFLRWPLRQGRLMIGAELGLGQNAGRVVVRPGLAFGRGFMLADRSGWISAEAQAELDRQGRRDLKADLTLGIALTARLTGMMQLQAGQPARDPQYLRVVPTLLWQVRKGTQVEFGLTQPVRGGGAAAIKLGLWYRF